MIFCKYFSIVCIASFIGCDLFQTRTPESPSEEGSNFIQPTTPEIVLINFKNAIEEYSIDNYIKCFVDASLSDKLFEFVPSLEAGIDRTRFDGWNLESERQYLMNLGKPSFGNANLTLSNKHIIAVTSDSVIYNYDYNLFYPQNNPNFPSSYTGNLQLYIAIDRNRNWSIYKWFDFKTNSSNTWSYLKAVFIGG
jgi:hypothetical protein